jgi:predicted glycogen debranching enzyme
VLPKGESIKFASVYEFGPEVLRDFPRASALEWLETNGTGGYASSSIVFANTRRYHGLLVAGSDVRSDRTVLVSKLDETIVTAEGSFELGCNQFPATIHPAGHTFLEHFAKDLFPQATYRAGGVTLRKTIVAPRGENTTIVLYEVVDAPGPFALRLQPFLAGRDYHALVDRAGWSEPLVHIRIDGARFESQPDWWSGFEYAIEIERGLPAHEDLFTPGSYVVTLQRGAVLPVALSTADAAGRDLLALVGAERARREALVVQSPDPLARTLTLAADSFVIEHGRGLETVIAGYHWFGDWGRDTMISLHGLTFTTHRFDDARRILRRFLATASKGMIPNRFPEGSDVPAYNAVDAGLWMFVAIWCYFDCAWDVDFVRNEAVPVLLEMIRCLERGTRFNIHVDDDGLLFAGASGVQLTWMDAKAGDVVITPRRGKPVEVNALWYNALRIAARLTESAALDARADAVRASFERAFWNEDAGCCFDVLGPVDASIRPNQLLALSLPFPLFDDARGQSILRVCEEQLLTPVGLRTLAPNDPHYRGQLIGDPLARDSAYHQGTVWPWLFGPYITALVRLRGEAGRAEARGVVERFSAHLGEAGLGTISEIFDGDAPHAPRGCIAQAWSVAELLRVWREEVNG